MVLRPRSGYGSRLRKEKVLALFTSIVLDGIHACCIDQRVLISDAPSADAKGERKRNKEERGMEEEVDSQRSRMISCLRIFINQWRIRVTQFWPERGIGGIVLARHRACAYVSHREWESERRSSADYGWTCVFWCFFRWAMLTFTL